MMNLYEFYEKNIEYSIEAIAADEELAIHVQRALIWRGLLGGSADGKFGPISAEALREFQRRAGCKENGFLGPETAKKLIEEKLDESGNQLLLGSDLASRMVAYMQRKGYQISTRRGEYSIIYVEGMNTDGTLNNDAPDQFNDWRLVLEVINGKPNIIDGWEATTEPGYYYTNNPMNPKGAARIAFGQYKAWQVGIHGNSEPHEALIQRAPIKVFRDKNKDMVRTGDEVDEGLFGVNQHWGYDYPRRSIRLASAGCLVGRYRVGHREFMKLVKQDRRYLLNNKYMFLTTVIAGTDLAKRPED